MLLTFLKRFGLTLAGAAIAAVAVEFANPANFTSLGAYAVVAAAAGAVIAGLLVALRDKLFPKA